MQKTSENRSRLYPIDAELSSRINFLRVVLIIMVAYIHVYSGEVHFSDGNVVMQTPLWLQAFQEITADIISRCAIPLFALISGFLLYSRDFTWLGNMKRKARSILLPYFLWNTLWILFYLFAQMIPFTANYFTSESIIIRNWGFGDWVGAYLVPFDKQFPFLYTFWFMRDLFILNALATVIRWLVEKMPLCTFCGICILWFSDISPVIVSNKTLCFFVLGCFIVRYKLSPERIDRINPYLLGGVYAAAVAWDYFSHAVQVHAICVVVGMVFFARLSLYVARSARLSDVFARLSGYVFFIFALHEMSLTIMKKLIVRLLLQTTFVQLAEFIFIPLAVVALCIVAAMVLRKIAPRCYAALTGGR